MTGKFEVYWIKKEWISVQT